MYQGWRVDDIRKKSGDVYTPPGAVRVVKYTLGVLISLWLFLLSIFLFVAQPKEFFVDGLKKLE
jgi:hypothetical protein